MEEKENTHTHGWIDIMPSGSMIGVGLSGNWNQSWSGCQNVCGRCFASIQNDDLWMDMVTKYSTELGWNGILDALDEYYKTAEDDLSLRFHNIGEIIASYAVKPKHAVEITSRNNLHKAPLHGAVWQIIMDFKEHNDDNKAMFDFAENELCYFKNYEGMGTTWISCEYIDFVFHIKKVLY